MQPPPLLCGTASAAVARGNSLDLRPGTAAAGSTSSGGRMGIGGTGAGAGGLALMLEAGGDMQVKQVGCEALHNTWVAVA